MNGPEKPDNTGNADYDDDVLDAGWVPQPEAVAPEPAAHPPRPSRVASEDADAFLDGVYRSQGDGFD